MAESRAFPERLSFHQGQKKVSKLSLFWVSSYVRALSKFPWEEGQVNMTWIHGEIGGKPREREQAGVSAERAAC